MFAVILRSLSTILIYAARPGCVLTMILIALWTMRQCTEVVAGALWFPCSVASIAFGLSALSGWFWLRRREALGLNRGWKQRSARNDQVWYYLLAWLPLSMGVWTLATGTWLSTPQRAPRAPALEVNVYVEVSRAVLYEIDPDSGEFANSKTLDLNGFANLYVKCCETIDAIVFGNPIPIRHEWSLLFDWREPPAPPAASRGPVKLRIHLVHGAGMCEITADEPRLAGRLQRVLTTSSNQLIANDSPFWDWRPPGLPQELLNTLSRPADVEITHILLTTGDCHSLGALERNGQIARSGNGQLCIVLLPSLPRGGLDQRQTSAKAEPFIAGGRIGSSQLVWLHTPPVGHQAGESEFFLDAYKSPAERPDINQGRPVPFHPEAERRAYFDPARFSPELLSNELARFMTVTDEERVIRIPVQQHLYTAWFLVGTVLLVVICSHYRDRGIHQPVPRVRRAAGLVLGVATTILVPRWLCHLWDGGIFIFARPALAVWASQLVFFGLAIPKRMLPYYRVDEEGRLKIHWMSLTAHLVVIVTLCAHPIYGLVLGNIGDLTGNVLALCIPALFVSILWLSLPSSSPWLPKWYDNWWPITCTVPAALAAVVFAAATSAPGRPSQRLAFDFRLLSIGIVAACALISWWSAGWLVNRLRQ